MNAKRTIYKYNTQVASMLRKGIMKSEGRKGTYVDTRKRTEKTEGLKRLLD